jgi:PleD family two-component response regulator
MDVFMPNRDGLDTLKALRSSPDTSHIPVVLISANPDLAGTLNTLEGGPVDFLAKPFALKTLLTTVNMVLKRSAVLTASGPGNDRETGLFDHVGVVNRLEQEMSRSVRYARPLTVVVLKPTMPPGDRVKALAGIVRHELRSPDVVGHLGQGVLATILPETPSDMARPLISRLCVLLQDHGVAYRSRLIDVRDDTASAEQILEQLLS